MSFDVWNLVFGIWCLFAGLYRERLRFPLIQACRAVCGLQSDQEGLDLLCGIVIGVAGVTFGGSVAVTEFPIELIGILRGIVELDGHGCRSVVPGVCKAGNRCVDVLVGRIVAVGAGNDEQHRQDQEEEELLKGFLWRHLNDLKVHVHKVTNYRKDADPLSEVCTFIVILFFKRRR